MRPIARAVPALLAAVLLLVGCAPMDEPAATGTDRLAWIRVADSPLSARHDALIAAVAGRFLVIGGATGPACPPNASCIRDDSPVVRDGAAYEPAADRWTAIADAPAPVRSHRAAALGDSLYLLTGYSGEPDERFLRYDASEDRWTSLPMPRHSPETLVAWHDRVVAVPSAEKDDGPVDAVFDPATGEWSSLPDDPLGPGDQREAVVTGGLLVLASARITEGSEPPVRRFATLDAPGGSWRRLPDSQIVGGGAIAAGGRVVLPIAGEADGGGVDGWGRSHPYGGVLDPATGEVTPLPAALGGRTCAGTVSIDGLAVGGDVVTTGCRFDPATGAVDPLPDSGLGDRFATSAASDGEVLLVWGGASGGRDLGDGRILRSAEQGDRARERSPTP